MDFLHYQRAARQTDRIPADEEAQIITPLLGLAGETGELLSEYKKHLRDREVHPLRKERVAEELGDLLWYVSTVASKFGLDLDAIAEANLTKARDRWDERYATPRKPFDHRARRGERFPRQFDVRLIQRNEDQQVTVRGFLNRDQVGADLTDNAYHHDGYRFHDVFHFAYAAVLGWSPVTRALLKRKRKSNKKIDEVEDGGRAIAIEEGISAFVFEYARERHWLKGASRIDSDLLKMIKTATRHLEVADCTPSEWERAILAGFEAWREIDRRRGGWLHIDLDARTIKATSRQKHHEVSGVSSRRAHRGAKASEDAEEDDQ
jgi:NTP pyrophosphatase (non-canonical NTP hydrolase)